MFFIEAHCGTEATIKEYPTMSRSWISLFAVAILAGWSSLAMSAEHTTDSLETVKAQLAADKAVLLDVREPSEWDSGHLKSAKSLPLSRLRKGIDNKELAKLMPSDRVIYAHCAAGVRCLEVADRLKQAGFEVRALKPGYRDLLSAGFEKAPE